MSNCCVFTERFCDSNGEVVIGKLVLKNGILQTTFYDIVGNQVPNDIVVPDCRQLYADLVDTETRLSIDYCYEGETFLTMRLVVSDLSISGIKDGSIFNMFIGIDPELTYELIDDNAPNIVDIIAPNKIVVLDASEIPQTGLLFKVKFRNENCNSQIQVTSRVQSISYLQSGWGNGEHTGNTINT